MVKKKPLVRAGAAVAALLGFAMITANTAYADSGSDLTDIFDAVGTTSIGSIGASMPLGPTQLTETTDVSTNDIVDGTLPIPSQQVQFDALGFVPIRATVTLTQVGPITGTIRSGTVARSQVIAADVAYTIRLSNVQAQIFGLWTPFEVGSHCQTVNPAQMAVATPAGQTFNVVTGGPVTGTYTIGQFTGCSAFFIPGAGSFVVNALVPGSNNTISLQLSNGHYAG